MEDSICLKYIFSEYNQQNSETDYFRYMEYNDEPDNKYGKIIKIILILSYTSYSGISLKNARQVHIMGPSLGGSTRDLESITQMTGRGIRLNERHFDIYRYRYK